MGNLDYENNNFTNFDLDAALEFTENQKFNPEDRVIIATILLPFIVIRGKDKKYSIEVSDENILYSIMFKMKDASFVDVIWVGILQNFSSYNAEELNEVIFFIIFRQIDEFLQEQNIYMIETTEIDYRDYWIYVNKILLPVFVSNSFDMNK